MTEEQKKLEGLMMEYIEREIRETEPGKASPTLPAMINELTLLWRITKNQNPLDV